MPEIFKIKKKLSLNRFPSYSWGKLSETAVRLRPWTEVFKVWNLWDVF